MTLPMDYTVRAGERAYVETAQGRVPVTVLTITEQPNAAGGKSLFFTARVERTGCGFTRGGTVWGSARQLSALAAGERGTTVAVCDE